MTDELKEKFDLLLDDIDHTFDADDRNALVGQMMIDVAFGILNGAKTMSDVTEHLALLISRVRQCDHVFEVVTQGDDDTVLDMARLSNAEAFKNWLEKVDTLIGRSHKTYHHIAWRQMWEFGRTPDEIAAAIERKKLYYDY